MKIGLSTYSLCNDIQSGAMSVLDALQWIADNGGEHAEIVPIGFDLHADPELIPQIREKAASLQLELSNYAVGGNFALEDDEAYEREVAKAMKDVDIARDLGVSLMRHDAAWADDVSIRNFNLLLPRIADACRRIADYAAPFGITTSVENHGYFVQASDRVQALLHAVGRDNFKTTIDIGNFLCADENPIVAVGKNIGFASMVHVKDFYVRNASRDPGEGWFRSSAGTYLRGAISGHGDIDLREALGIVKRSGYDGFLSIEFEGMEECKKASKISMDNVRRHWNAL